MIQTLNDRLFAENDIIAATLRLDLLHPEVSGNKWFKLKYHLAEATSQKKTGIVSFGGAYSNHLVAMAVACRANNLKATAIIRGDESRTHNPSIVKMREYGTELVFAGRDVYKNKELLISDFLSGHPEYYYIPEGGQSLQGIKGASEILQPEHSSFTHVICAVGTGTTIAGLINNSLSHQHIIGICSLKVGNKSENELLDFLTSNTSSHNYTILFDYHFGGYAKKTDALLHFMNELYRKEKIPTDFVYTGKLFYATYDLTGKKYFPRGSKILIVHSGGLQGNKSIPEGVLNF